MLDEAEKKIIEIHLFVAKIIQLVLSLYVKFYCSHSGQF